MTLLNITNMSAFYKKSRIISDLNMVIGKSEAVALLGRNGSGKSTTIRSIVGIEPPRTDGDMIYKNSNINKSSPNKRHLMGISWVPERRRVFPNLSVRNNLKLGKNKRDNSMDIDVVFKLFPKLEDRMNQKAGTMSGGEQQMLSIGRALVCSPDLLLIDEPFEGLMPSLVSSVSENINQLSHSDVAILIAEQNIKNTLNIADRVYILDKGEVVHEGSAEEIKQNRKLRREYLGVSK